MMPGEKLMKSAVVAAPVQCKDELVKKQSERPVLITDAARSQGDQLRSRQVRYVSMMGLRTLCLIAGAILISIQPPLLPLWLVFCALGMVFLPWMAVLIANDRPPKSREHPAVPQPGQRVRALDAESAEHKEQRTIDVEP
jgi:Flp pilus assembly protein TadB